MVSALTDLAFHFLTASYSSIFVFYDPGMCKSIQRVSSFLPSLLLSDNSHDDLLELPRLVVGDV